MKPRIPRRRASGGDSARLDGGASIPVSARPWDVILAGAKSDPRIDAADGAIGLDDVLESAADPSEKPGNRPNKPETARKAYRPNLRDSMSVYRKTDASLALIAVSAAR